MQLSKNNAPQRSLKNVEWRIDSQIRNSQFKSKIYGLPRRSSERLSFARLRLARYRSLGYAVAVFVLRYAPNEDGWACLESNQGPRPYQGRALTN